MLKNIAKQFYINHLNHIKYLKYLPANKNELESLVYDERIHLGDIDTSFITDMSELFRDSERKDFSGIESWNVSNVRNMEFMFDGADAFIQHQRYKEWANFVKYFKSIESNKEQ